MNNTNHSKELKKENLKTTEKTQKWGRSVPEPEMGEIWAGNGSLELGDLVGGRSVGEGDHTVVGFWPEMENDGGRL
jgi:hypothetical protein